MELWKDEKQENKTKGGDKKMKRKNTTGLLAIVAIIAVVMFSGCVEPEVSTHPATTPTGTVPSETSAPASTTTQTPTPTATPAPRGSYQNPADISETVRVKTGGTTLDITVLEVERGETVWEEIYAENMFNDEPKPGFEYLRIKLNVAYVSGASSQYISSYSFKAFAAGVGYSSEFVVAPHDKPEFEGVDLMPGGQTEGWIYYMAPKDEEVLISYEELFDQVCFINIGS